uniref:Uncharacterized protein n=1 Tax=Arundo donax TaxID=35708 RepID=A0A0A9EVW8_ARUDO
MLQYFTQIFEICTEFVQICIKFVGIYCIGPCHLKKLGDITCSASPIFQSWLRH